MADDDLTGDILDGMRAICRGLKITERQGYELAETGKLPLFKLGDRKWQGRRSTLKRHVENLEARRDGKAA